MSALVIRRDDGTELRILAEPTTIGREETNTIALPNDTGVSRSHARITSAGEGHVLSDLGSRNGTYLERGSETRRVDHDMTLEPGDVIVVGETRLVVEAANSAATAILDPELTNVPAPTRVGLALPDLGTPPEAGGEPAVEHDDDDVPNLESSPKRRGSRLGRLFGRGF
jgi:pSer/pThr/pTyr-binding forkhead associated (FHA) protein